MVGITTTAGGRTGLRLYLWVLILNKGDSYETL